MGASGAEKKTENKNMEALRDILKTPEKCGNNCVRARLWFLYKNNNGLK